MMADDESSFLTSPRLALESLEQGSMARQTELLRQLVDRLRDGQDGDSLRLNSALFLRVIKRALQEPALEEVADESGVDDESASNNDGSEQSSSGNPSSSAAAMVIELASQVIAFLSGPTTAPPKLRRYSFTLPRSDSHCSSSLPHIESTTLTTRQPPNASTACLATPTSSNNNTTMTVAIEEDQFASAGLGWKTWNAAQFFMHWISSSEEQQHMVTGKRVLELGAGTGLAGITCALLSARSVLLTDFNDAVLKRLAQNVSRNKCESKCHVVKLDWTQPPESYPAEVRQFQPEVIVGTDVVYEPEHAPALARVIQAIVRCQAGASATSSSTGSATEHPRRDPVQVLLMVASTRIGVPLIEEAFASHGLQFISKQVLTTDDYPSIPSEAPPHNAFVFHAAQDESLDCAPQTTTATASSTMQMMQQHPLPLCAVTAPTPPVVATVN